MNRNAYTRSLFAIISVFLLGCTASREEESISSGMNLEDAQHILALAQSRQLERKSYAGYSILVYELLDGKQVGLQVGNKGGVISSLAVANPPRVLEKNSNGVYRTKFYPVRSISVVVPVN